MSGSGRRARRIVNVAGAVMASISAAASAGGPSSAGDRVTPAHIPAGRGAWVLPESPEAGSHSVARRWNEATLNAIRNDLARPTVHARNLYHVSAAMWDAWAAYASAGSQLFHGERVAIDDGLRRAAREEAISYAAYRVLVHRFSNSVGADDILPVFDALMADLGYDPSFTSQVGDSPAALGNRVGNRVIVHNRFDGANEAQDYANLLYRPVNPPLVVDFPGNPDILDANRWQPLSLEFFVDQSGNPVPFGSLEFLSPEWGLVRPFAMSIADATLYRRGGFNYFVYHDPGNPPRLGTTAAGRYKRGFEMVVSWASHLDATDPHMIDASPGSFGNTPTPTVDDADAYYDFAEGGDWGLGHDTNPATGEPYPPQVVRRGDFARVLAEFWADGPDSETPPGHWFTILNYVSDHPDTVKRLHGVGPVVDDLEWDVRAYVLMGGAMHDAAVSAWGIKGWYDYIRPVSAIRYMIDRAQAGAHPDEITLIPGLIERITPASAATYHAHLADQIGKIAVRSWRGPDFIGEPAGDEPGSPAGVGWILGENWWPYQRPTFVTPPFAGYVSGHSTFSRAAAEVLTRFTGDAFFPGGVGAFYCPQDEFLVFERGPSEDVTLQWATYRDAADQSALSRIWGGIHPPADDIPGRHIGIAVGTEAYRFAVRLFQGSLGCEVDLTGDLMLDVDDLLTFLARFNEGHPAADLSEPYDLLDMDDVQVFLNGFAAGCP